ncbi:hypothetical protein ACHAWU_001123 [Discostella pseudostelligera]|uniref:Glycosyltransferase family 92 protein n=1 Tax=Discostella pseudostelligera TaxID=259834 RepID=A0ABD3MFV0_9STRA
MNDSADHVNVTRRKKWKNTTKRCSLIAVFFSTALLVSTSTLYISWSWLAIQTDEKKLEDSTALYFDERSSKEFPSLRQKKRIFKNESDTVQVVSTAEISEVTSTEQELDHSSDHLDSALSSGTHNSDIYQPHKAGKRLLTYGRFGGRLNNQLFQFITALQHAKVLKRTLVVPDEVRDVDWTGMFDVGFGIWDLESLNAAYDIDWTTGLSADFTSSIPNECVLTPKEGRDLLSRGPELWNEWDTKCPDVIDLAGRTGLLFCEQQHQFCGDYEAKMEAYNIYSHIKLSPSLLQYTPSKRNDFKSEGFNELAIHSRRAGEGGYDWELCIKGNSRTCRGHTTGNARDLFCDIRTMKGNCAIWLDLDYQIKSKSALKTNQKDYRFVLASDGAHDWSIDFKSQFIAANNTDWLLDLEKKIREHNDPEQLIESMSVSSLVRSKLKGKKELSKLRENLDSVTATLLDLFSLIDSKYLLGAYYSTLSLNACYFRGLDRIYDSNMCWMLMHPSSEYAITPSPRETVNLHNTSQNDNLPAALMSDVEHAFIRSDDGNFIAIGRYLIRYGKGEVIGILGDGLVPLMIEKTPSGEESVRANFTCSYGEIQDSPATVILMKGDQSIEEHYYKRGSKYKTPFSANGDRFRTMIILCEKLKFDRGLSRHPPLILQSQDDNFSVTIGSSFQRPVGQVKSAKSSVRHNRLVHCLNPVYGLKDPRWLIEYLEYHRAIGVEHVHVYNVDLHTPGMQSALELYRKEGFITRHDWSGKASGGYTQITYEHAKWAAQTDCALRSRGMFDYALFSDIDEVAVGPDSSSISAYPNGHLAPALDLCDEANKQNGKIACSFNSKTVTSIYTKLDKEEELASKDKLIMERYNRIEANPFCPANCRCRAKNCTVLDQMFHYGRQKYFANVGDTSIPPRPMWTHALSRDYNEMKSLMEVLPEEVMHVRHYQGHWYIDKNMIDSVEEVDAPLLQSLMGTVRSSILDSTGKESTHTKQSIYSNAKDVATSSGLDWITPVTTATSQEEDE